MKGIYIGCGVTLLGCLLDYLCFSFAIWSAHPGDWSQENRSACAVLVIFAIAIGIGVGRVTSKKQGE